MRHSILLAALLVLLNGCGAFSPPKAKPVIEDTIEGGNSNRVGVLATTPERRVVIVKMPQNLFCAEPPADAAENVSAALAVIAEAAAKGNLSELQLGTATTLATTVKQLFQRSQGVQLYRDGSFMLCTAYLNGILSQSQFVERHTKLLDVVAPLIAAEIPHLHIRHFDETTVPGTPAVPTVALPPVE